MKKYVLILIKFLIAGFIVYLIFKDLEFGKITESLANINFYFFAIAILIYSNIFLLFSVRWKLFNNIYSISLKFSELVKHYLIAFFFNNFLISSIGGDFWRIKKIYDACSLKGKSVFIPVLERLTGFFAVALLSPLSFYIFAEKIDAEELKLATYFLIAILFLISLLLFSKSTFKLLAFIRKKINISKLPEFIDTISEILEIVQNNKTSFYYGIILSALSQLMYAISSFIICIALSVDISLLIMLAIVPMVYIVSMLPISINGLGVRESFITWSLSQFFIDKNVAAAVALLISVKQIVVSLAGGILFLANRKV